MKTVLHQTRSALPAKTPLAGARVAGWQWAHRFWDPIYSEHTRAGHLPPFYWYRSNRNPRLWRVTANFSGYYAAFDATVDDFGDLVAVEEVASGRVADPVATW